MNFRKNDINRSPMRQAGFSTEHREGCFPDGGLIFDGWHNLSEVFATPELSGEVSLCFVFAFAFCGSALTMF